VTMELASTCLIDCTGATTHTLTLLIDGRVRVRFASGVEADVDPVTGTVLTPGRAVPEPVIAAARSLRVG
jgi:hypothetical protein